MNQSQETEVPLHPLTQPKSQRKREYSHKRLFEYLCFFLKYSFTRRSATNAVRVIVPAIVPNIMPTNAPFLIPDDDEGNSEKENQKRK